MVTGRKKLINVILVVPTLFLLKNYFAVHRALCLIHTDSPDFLSRGTAYFYGYDNKRILYNRHKKIQYTDLKLSTFSFKFMEQPENLYDMNLYDKMKDEAIASIGEEKKDTQSNRNKKKTKTIRNAIKYFYDVEGMKFKEIAEILELGKDDVRHYYNLKEEEEKKKNQTENIVKECEKDSLKEGLVFNTELDSIDEVEE